MSVTTLLAISLGAILTNNFIFSQFLGICPFLGVSKKIDTAVGMGAAVTFVMGLASAFCYMVNLILVPLHLEFMQTVAFILVIAGLVQFVEMFLKKNIPTLYTALGVYLPLITTNCAVLGVALLNVQNDYNFISSVVYGITGGLGFLLAIFLFAAVREQLEVSSDIPKSFEGFPIVLFAAVRESIQFAENPKCFDGFPIALVTAGLMALAFMGFSGLKVW
jgi:electron transport complex protein RnfA